MSISIKGRISRVLFHSEKNGYSAIKITNEEGEFSAAGKMDYCQEGLSFEFTGEMVTHPKYGEQLSFTKYKELELSKTEKIFQVLSSGILKGVGPKTAEDIIKVFGEESLQVIENESDRLISIQGIGDTKLGSIVQSFKENKPFIDVFLELQKFDITPILAKKLYKEYGEEAQKFLEENPYRIARDIDGLGFVWADKLAEKIGISDTDKYRIQSGLFMLLFEAEQEGHCFLPYTDLVDRATIFLEISAEPIEDEIYNLSVEGDIIQDKIHDIKLVYLPANYYSEKTVANKIKVIVESEKKLVSSDMEFLIKRSEQETKIKYSEPQKVAIKSALNNSMTIITGGPGTGKTTIIRGIIKIFEHSELEVVVAAPTGRAAKRITEATGYPAQTIHRLLGFTKSKTSEEYRFERNEENPLEYDVIILDEASMIDIKLMKGLLDAFPAGGMLIMVGDVDQLQPIGAGNVFQDFIDSEFIFSVHLKEIYRQAKESLIVVNAHKINRGEYPDLSHKDKDFFLVNVKEEERFHSDKTQDKILKTIVDLCNGRLANYFEDINNLTDIQVLTPRKQGMVGTVNLNKSLQKVLNPASGSKNEIKSGDRIFRTGDKVMHNKNNYEIDWKNPNSLETGKGVFNGELGNIVEIDSNFNEITVNYNDEKLVKYNPEILAEIEPAFAVTVHKSQGSEFPVIVMPVTWFPDILATRNLFYTAITRGQKAVVLVGSEDYVRRMVDNKESTKRYTALKDRLADFIPKIRI
ncbi:MAG: SF1B family DNA helicase RecD2 [Anaerovoracaceae bacterium]